MKKRAEGVEKDVEKVVRRYPAATGLIGLGECRSPDRDSSNCRTPQIIQTDSEFDVLPSHYTTVNVAAIGTLSYLAYSHWHLPQWDRRTVTLTSLALGSLFVGEGSVGSCIISSCILTTLD